MAGIGFELKLEQERDTGLLGRMTTYTCAALISSGPWIITTGALSLLSLLGPLLGDDTDYSALRSLITYAFAFSLITVGIAQMAVTRKVADVLYAGRPGSVLPAFTSLTWAVALVQSIVAAVFCYLVELPLDTSVVLVALYAIVSMSWIALVWLSVTRDYQRILRAYVYGCLFSIVAVLGLALTHGATGMLAAYTAGQGLTYALLVRAIARGVASGPKRELLVFKGLTEYPALVGAGFFYSLAIWVDKLVFWMLDGIGPHPWIRTHPMYESSCFLAYLTVVPALAVNLIHLETRFYERYRAYFDAILDGFSLDEIQHRRKRMMESLREGTVRLLRVQSAITALCIALAPSIVAALEMPEATVRVFRLCCLGAFFHVLFSITILVQLYFDLRRQALLSALAFLLLNAVLAWWSLSRGVGAYGAGYAGAALCSLVISFVLLNDGVKNLEYRIFSAQALEPEADEPDEDARAETAAA